MDFAAGGVREVCHIPGGLLKGSQSFAGSSYGMLLGGVRYLDTAHYAIAGIKDLHRMPLILGTRASLTCPMPPSDWLRRIYIRIADAVHLFASAFEPATNLPFPVYAFLFRVPLVNSYNFL